MMTNKIISNIGGTTEDSFILKRRPYPAASPEESLRIKVDQYGIAARNADDDGYVGFIGLYLVDSVSGEYILATGTSSNDFTLDVSGTPVTIGTTDYGIGIDAPGFTLDVGGSPVMIRTTDYGIACKDAADTAYGAFTGTYLIDSYSGSRIRATDTSSSIFTIAHLNDGYSTPYLLFDRGLFGADVGFRWDSPNDELQWSDDGYIWNKFTSSEHWVPLIPDVDFTTTALTENTLEILTDQTDVLKPGIPLRWIDRIGTFYNNELFA